MAPRTKKLINQPETILQDMLEGIASAYPDVVRLTDSGLIIRATPKTTGKVGLVIGNGTGHEPAMIGLVGQGLFDVNVPVKSSQHRDQIGLWRASKLLTWVAVYWCV